MIALIALLMICITVWILGYVMINKATETDGISMLYVAGAILCIIGAFLTYFSVGTIVYALWIS